MTLAIDQPHRGNLPCVRGELTHPQRQSSPEFRGSRTHPHRSVTDSNSEPFGSKNPIEAKPDRLAGSASEKKLGSTHPQRSVMPCKPATCCAFTHSAADQRRVNLAHFCASFPQQAFALQAALMAVGYVVQGEVGEWRGSPKADLLRVSKLPWQCHGHSVPSRRLHQPVRAGSSLASMVKSLSLINSQIFLLIRAVFTPWRG